jgi:hypothetical protein
MAWQSTIALPPCSNKNECKPIDVEEMESSSKIDMRDVSWWMSIKKTCRPGALVIARL